MPGVVQAARPWQQVLDHLQMRASGHLPLCQHVDPRRASCESQSGDAI